MSFRVIVGFEKMFSDNSLCAPDDVIYEELKMLTRIEVGRGAKHLSFIESLDHLSRGEHGVQ